MQKIQFFIHRFSNAAKVVNKRIPRGFSLPNVHYAYNHYPKDAGYYHQTVLPPEDVAEVNQHDYDVFREKFIDPMKVVKNADGSYRIFTPERKLISHDGLHLTRAGAKYYASRMNIISYFKE